MDIEQLNADWLAAWSAKDVDGVASFYSSDVRYFDAQVPGGLEGQDALKAYLKGLFDAVPPITYRPEAVWAIEGGFCGRWIAEVEMPDNARSRLRGFDLCLLRGGKIAHNEVYTHDLGTAEP